MFPFIYRYHPFSKVRAVLPLCVATLSGLGCSEGRTTAGPTEIAAGSQASAVEGVRQDEDKGYINGWFDTQDVQLYYTKSYFCAKTDPPMSAAPSNCEIGAPAEIIPRPGNIRTIYAIAPVGFQPADSTLSCVRGSPCLNHPGMIDASRIGGPQSGPGLSHSHILDERGGGWHKTVNIRVFTQAAWTEIANAKTLAKVRELQGGNPEVGVPGVISADTPTNIYFFIAGWR
jgi:hypothetical protein